MKKEINSKSRRKWIRGGLAAFASVALLTTGFAVWVVGVQKDKVNGDIGVTVDTAQNESVLFDATLNTDDKSIVLGEPAQITDGFVKNNDVKEDLTVTFSKFEISVGQAVVDNYNQLKLSLIPNPDENNGGKFDGMTFADNKAETAKLDNKLTNGKRPETNATYFDLVTETIDLPTSDVEASDVSENLGFSRKTTNSVTKYELVTKSVKLFKWGTFFNSVSPCNFYNDVLASAQTPENADKVQGELADMAAKYASKHICLHMELAKKATDTVKE